MTDAKRPGSEANELLKKLLEQKPYGMATAAFLFEWEDASRVPRSIRFPDGQEREVHYMRDGILTFRDSRVPATYDRVLDTPSEKKSIVVYYQVNDPSVCN